MSVERFTADHPLWDGYRDHLARVKMDRWALVDGGNPAPDVFYLGMPADGLVIAHIALRRQPLIVPATDWSGGESRSLTRADGESIDELFVQTFAVETSYRRQGHGRALQQAALALTAELGCYQMRSWSSLDKTENYALKLSLGFAAHPAICETDNGQRISGVYFVKTVQRNVSSRTAR